MRTIKILFPVMAIILLLTSCGKTSYKKTNGGMPYQLYRGKDTTNIKPGNIVKVNLTYKVKDSIFFSTDGKLPIYLPVTDAPQPYDISEIWTKMKVGDSLVATQMMDTFIKRSPGNIPPQYKKGDRIVTYVKVLAVFSSDTAASADEEKGKKQMLTGEIESISKYLASKNITAEKTASGAFVQLLNPGTGNLIDSGKYISVNYTGTSFSGKRFDSNTDTAFHHVQPYSFTVGAGQMIKGFDESMKLLRLGAKAKIFIPSMLGYAGNPDPRSGIKQYENLIFDIDILDIKDKAPQMAAPEMPKREIKIDSAQSKK